MLLKTSNTVELGFSVCFGNSLKFVNRMLDFHLNLISVRDFDKVIQVYLGGFFVCLDSVDSENKATEDDLPVFTRTFRHYQLITSVSPK